MVSNLISQNFAGSRPRTGDVELICVATNRSQTPGAHKHSSWELNPGCLQQRAGDRTISQNCRQPFCFVRLPHCPCLSPGHAAVTKLGSGIFKSGTSIMPPWPNGQGVGLLIRRLRVRVPQGVTSCPSSRTTHLLLYPPRTRGVLRAKILMQTVFLHP